MDDHNYLKKKMSGVSRYTSKCVVPGSGGTHDVTKFPRNEERCRIWSKAIGANKKYNNENVICKSHFKPDCFKVADANKLHDKAVPSIFPGKNNV
jgi:hypothetical protein